MSATLLDAKDLRSAVSQASRSSLEDRCSGGVYTGGLHLAIMTGPFLRMICEGTKTVESRFHQQRRSPLFIAAAGDVVVFRQSGDVARFAARIGQTWFIDLEEISLSDVRAQFQDAIGCDHDSFWDTRARARWVTLMHLDEVFEIEPRRLRKRDRRGWVTYAGHPQSGANVRSQTHESRASLLA